MPLSAVVVIVVLSIGLGVPLYAAWRTWRDGLRYVAPTGRERKERHEKLLQRMPRDEQVDSTAALFVFEQAQSSLELVVAANKSLEEKARGLLTIIVSGTGALAILGPTAHASPSSILVVGAALAAIGALVSCLIALRVKYRPGVSVHQLIAGPTTRDPAIQFAIALSLAEEYAVKAARLGQARRFDPTFVLAAQTLLVAAVVLLLGNYLTGGSNDGAVASTTCPVTRTRTGALVAKCPGR